MVLHPESTSPITLASGTDYNLLPVGAPSGVYSSIELASTLVAVASSSTAFNFGYALVDITGAWGFPTIPPEVKRAAAITVGSWLRKDVTALLAEADIGGGFAPAFPSTLEIPRNAKALYAPYVRLRQYIG
jgi:hypothetical protein